MWWFIPKNLIYSGFEPEKWQKAVLLPHLSHMGYRDPTSTAYSSWTVNATKMGLVSFERTFQKLSKAHVVHSDWSEIKDTVLLQCMKKFVFCCGWTNHLIWLIAPKKIIAGKTRLVYLKGQGHRKIIKCSFAPWGLLMAQSKPWKGVLITKKWHL